jgi:hypothetical protein
MKFRAFHLLAALLVPGFWFLVSSSHAQPPLALGDPLPATLSAGDSNGKTHTLSTYKGKIVVVEWHNPGCPFTRKHYESGNMQKLQATYTGKGVVWLTVNSASKGKQGYLTAAEAPAAVAKEDFKGTAYLLDPTGTLGHAFGAATTPHMFIFDATGKLAYMGAIDAIPSFDKEDIAKATNYVSAALEELLAGKPVTTAQTNPYGCSVKY